MGEGRVLARGCHTEDSPAEKDLGMRNHGDAECRKRKSCWREGCGSGGQWEDGGRSRFLGGGGQCGLSSLSLSQLCLSIAHWLQGTAGAEESSSDLAAAALFSLAMNQEGEPKGRTCSCKGGLGGEGCSSSSPTSHHLSAELCPCTLLWELVPHNLQRLSNVHKNRISISVFMGLLQLPQLNISSE